ncbi:uncharacterized protein LOC110657937 [Hevea brasiliensis]|nr:uncharacterized protein LOC110657937 [Hevea brasiliensis]
MLFENGKQEAGPVEEFQRLGLMLFVAVPFLVLERGPEPPSLLFLICRPGRLYQEIFGVVLAGLPVNLLVNLVLKYAIVTGIILFLISTFMWFILRNIGSLCAPQTDVFSWWIKSHIPLKTQEQ